MNRANLLAFLAMTTIALCKTAAPAAAQCAPQEVDQAIASDAGAGDLFGGAVALSGDTAVVGAYANDDAGASSGAAYIYLRSGSEWVIQAKLTAADAEADDNFGYSVAISGNTAVIGARWTDDHYGSAYVFTRSGTVWSQQAKLTAPDGAPNDGLGNAVAIDGDTVLAGAYAKDSSGGADVGAVYVFERLGTVWVPRAKLTALDAEADDNFGYSVAISGNTALVGARWTDDHYGSAYAFTRTNNVWTQQAKLTASDGAPNDGLGNAVALSGDTALVGAYADDDAGLSSGSAYVFVRDGTVWTQQAKLTAADAEFDDNFGYSVAIEGDRAVVGARWTDDHYGSAYAFHRLYGPGAAHWGQLKMVAADGSANDALGWSVALSNGVALVGANRDDVGGALDAGSAYVFELNCLPGSALGDMNCDGALDFFDIDPFLLALFDATGYATAHPDCDRARADMNYDSTIDFFDIDGLLTCLFGGCP